MIYFFKLIYHLRKKIAGASMKYVMLEYRYLYNKRIKIDKSFSYTKIPNLYFDVSDSQLILHPHIAIRGEVSFLFYNNGLIEVGENTFFNQSCSVNCMEKITVGAYCLFGENVKLYDHNHQYKNKEVSIKDQGYTTAPILVGNNCWFGSNVTILKGVIIGDGCVVGANCIVNKNLPSGTIMYANARTQITKSITEE